MIFNVRNAALIYACLAATASTSPVFANDDPHRKPTTKATRTILKPDPHGSKGLHVVTQGDDGGDPPPKNVTRTILKPALKEDAYAKRGWNRANQGDDGGDPHRKPPTKATRTIMKNAHNNDPHFANGLHILNQEKECVDVPGWQDSLGSGCDYYSKGINCLLFGWAFKNDGYTASEACCACGGGNMGGGDDDDDNGNGGESGVVYGLQPSCNSDDSANYNMCLDLVSLSGSYESWMESFAKATQKWESIIVGDLPSIASSELDDDPDERCTGYPTTFDDVYLCGREESIDGPGGVLGSASALYSRGSGVINPRTGEEYRVTLTGRMQFDSDDIADLQSNGEFDEVVFHEMAHIVGAGILWVDNGLYENDSGEYASGTHADDEWKAIGCSGPLPVELDGGEGTADGHWDEGCFQHEIMTGELSGSAQPVSRITVGTFEDMGYLVDYSKADPFTVADLSYCASYCPEARRGLRQRERKVKARLDKDGETAVMRYAKTELTRRHKEFEIAAARHGDRNDGIKAVEELNVLYRDAGGRLHTVHATWNQVKDLHI